MMIHEITAQAGAHKKRMRVGRGESSGKGKTCGRGTKGQGARPGSKAYIGHEGGAIPLYRRLPKRGFNNIFRTEYTVLGLDRVAEILATAPETEFTLDKIVELGLLRKKGGLVKVLNNGELSGPVTIHAHKFSKTAQEAIEKAGGKAVLIG
jgi:large subunit ribosomal protein L15